MRKRTRAFHHVPAQPVFEQSASVVDAGANHADGVDAADCEWRGPLGSYGRSRPRLGARPLGYTQLIALVAPPTLQPIRELLASLASGFYASLAVAFLRPKASFDHHMLFGSCYIYFIPKIGELMELLKNWNGKSISFFSKLQDPPLPIPGLISPMRLFNIVFNTDGSLYTSYFGSSTEVITAQVVNYFPTQQQVSPTSLCQELRISIHGSGEVRSFIRGEDEIISHLGVQLREINQPIILAEHRLGSAGAYVHHPLEHQNAKSTATIIPGLFEQLLRPVFQISASSDDFCPTGNSVVWSGLTRQMDNGKKLVFAVSLTYEPWNCEASREHEIRVFATATKR